MSAGWFLSMLLAAAFEVQTVPLESPDARIFTGDVNGDGLVDVVTLVKRTLRFHLDRGEDPPRRVDLPPEARAFDVADLDGDGACEVVALLEESVWCLDIPQPGALAMSRKLFDADTGFANAASLPILYPATVEREGRVLFALPRQGAYELHAPDGELVASVPAKSGQAGELFEDAGFHRNVFSSEPAGQGGVLSIHISDVQAPTTTLPEGVTPRGTLREHVADGQTAEAGYGFSRSLLIRAEDGYELRAKIDLAEEGRMDTLLRVRRASAEELAAADEAPALQYPGRLLAPDDALPDFNGDGHGDLLLWKAPEPGTSIESAIRAVSGGTWPVRLTVHPYEPGKMRFTPRPFATLETRVSLGLLLDGEEEPVANLVLRDFNGDGRTDLSFSPNRETWSVWLAARAGFPRTPDFTRRFPESVRRVFDEGSVGGPWAVGLKGRSRLYVICGVPERAG